MIVRFAEPVPAPFVALISTTLPAATASGVPEITPVVAFRVSPVGKAPEPKEVGDPLAVI